MKKEQMTKRERVEATMNLRETDRVPVYDLMFSDPCMKYFTGKIAPYGEEGVNVKCKTIRRTLDMTRAADGGPNIPGSSEDEDGFVYTFDRWCGLGYIKKPFSDESGAVEWLKKANCRLVRELKELDAGKIAKDLRDRFLIVQKMIGDDTVVLIRDSGTGLDHVRQKLGLQLFSYIAYDQPDLISEYMELFTTIEVRIIQAYADRKLSPCALTFGDIAMKNTLMHSPDWLRKEFIPRLKRINDAYHELEIKCLFHSDGNIMEIIEDLIMAGIDGINPIETIAGMNLADLKRLYGSKLFFAGGIDMSQLLSTGNCEDVRKACVEAIKVASPGYFLGSTTELDNSAKLDNILTMFETAGVDIRC